MTALRRALPQDLLPVVAFLRRQERGAMFPLALLAERRGDPGAFQLWLAEQAGAVTGALMLTGRGALLARGPGVDWRPLRPALAGQAVSMALAPDGQVRPLLAALGLDAMPRHAVEEPGYTLDLDDLSLPSAEGCHLIPAGPAQRGLLTRWRADYLSETFATPSAEATTQAAGDVDRWLRRGSHRLLMRQDQAVSLSGFNASLPDVAQIGGVYTPPALRCQGLARACVARHLAEARANGLRRAVLFAASDAAARAYRAIGFRPEGTMGLVQFATPQEITS